MILAEIHRRVVDCQACPRLVTWREEVGRTKRAAYRDADYWARPVPGFGDPRARLVVLGLAPGAHGANRTGRPFTGDGAGEFLYRALHRVGFASQPQAGEAQRLRDCWVTNAVKCVPPRNLPTAAERDACAGFLRDELAVLPVRVVLALGATGWNAALRVLGSPHPKPVFAHAAEVRLPAATLLASFHPSRQNTNTGRLTQDMLDAVVARAAAMLEA